MRKLIALLTGGRVVWLMDYDGEITKSIAYASGFGLMSASRMISRKVTLHPDGSVSGASYVKRWEFAE